MTAREMYTGFMNQLFTINPALENDEIIDSTLALYYINLAQYRYLNDKYLGSSITENVGKLNKNIEDIKKLIKRVTLLNSDLTAGSSVVNISELGINGSAVVIDFISNNIPISASLDGGISLPLPSDYFYYLRSTSKVSLGDSVKATPDVPATNPTILTNTLINYADFNSSLITNSNNKPILRNPVVLLELSYSNEMTNYHDKMTIYLDSYTTLYNVEYTYIKKPNAISLGSYLDTNTSNDCELSESTHKDIVEMAVKIFIEENKYKLNTNKAQR